MEQILLGAIFLSILAMFFEGYIVFKNLKNKLHAYLFLNCVVMIVNNIGYLLQLVSKTEDAYIAALKFSYAGRVWILFSLFMFSAELCHVALPKFLINGFIIFDIAVYFVVFTFQQHSLYYSMTYFDKRKLFPVLLHRNGIIHNIFMMYQIVIIVIVFYWLIKSFINCTGKTARKRILIIIAGFLIESILYLIQILHLLFITYFFDISVLGNVVLTIFIFIAIFRYNLLGIIDLAKEYIVDRLSEGVIAVDSDGNLQYYNEHVKELFPDIIVSPDEVINKLQQVISAGESLTFGDRFYTPERKELLVDDEIIGELYALIDTTVLKQNEYKLKSEAAILEMAASKMRERLLTTEELIKQDRAMCHDRRHFEALLLSLLQEGNIDKAKQCLEERMAIEPRSAKRYCDNATVNAALTHYVNIAEKNGIKTTVYTNIPFELSIDEMKLAIVISNLLENAIHACEALPESSRFIEVTAKYKSQLLIEIANSCLEKVSLDAEGHPYSLEANHGVGTKSVLAFIEEVDGDIRYIAEGEVFKVRLIL